MIVNPYRESDRLVVIPGTRMIQDSFGLVGCSFEDPRMSDRSWVIVGLYYPVPGRALGGVRARLLDQKGFVSFCNQRDLEILLNLAKGGQYCPWTGANYPYVNDEEDGWVGLCADEVDLSDDLFERELALRAQHEWGVLPSGSMERRIHRGDNHDAERTDILLWDADPQTGMGPDPSLENLGCRWQRVEEKRVVWEHL